MLRKVLLTLFALEVLSSTAGGTQPFNMNSLIGEEFRFGDISQADDIVNGLASQGIKTLGLGEDGAVENIAGVLSDTIENAKEAGLAQFADTAEAFTENIGDGVSGLADQIAEFAGADIIEKQG